MKLITNILLYLIAIFLVYMIVQSVKEPIDFQSVRKVRKDTVVDKLKLIRKAQDMHLDITGKFAADFDSLSHVLTTGRFRTIKVLGDPDDPTSEFSYDTSYSNAIDSIKALKWNLDSLRYVPYGGGAIFDIAADTMTYQQTLVNVVEVGTYWKDFMGKYADLKYSQYDQSYDPNRRLKFGDLGSPNTSGNWE